MKFVFNGVNYELEFEREYRPVPVDRMEDGEPLFESSKYPYTTVTLWKQTTAALPEIVRNAARRAQANFEKLAAVSASQETANRKA